VKISLSAGQELLDTKGANLIIVSLKATVDTDSVAEKLARYGIAHGMEVRTWRELNDFYSKTVQLYDRQFGVLRLIILVMVLLSVLNAVNMSIMERAGEFGTMRALGNRGRRVFGTVLLESLLLGTLGAVVGTVIGVLLALAISAIGIPMPPPPNSNLGYTAHIRIIPSVVAGAFLVGLAATVLASVPPAIRVSRMPVVDALRQNV
jgi:putative ABC transport system permease protein